MIGLLRPFIRRRRVEMTKKNGDNVALYLFHQGNNMRAYEYMGVHKVKGEKDLFSVHKDALQEKEGIHLCGPFLSNCL